MTMTAPHQPLSGDALLQRFNALDAFLCAHQALWKPRPFTHRQLPWEGQYPGLASWLRGRTLEQAEAAHNQPTALQHAPEPYPELAAEAERLAAVADLPRQVTADLPARFSVDVPGRKWQQILAFSASLRFDQAPRHWLDWCAGKGHLGRVLAHSGQPLTCLEHDPALVTSGAALSQRLGIAARHVEQDVLAGGAAEQLLAEHSPVALHACGDLHVRLLQLASAAGSKQLAIAPCCYNRTAASSYRGLSTAAQASPLDLSLDDLALPMSETVTAGNRVRQQRDQSMAWRLAFDQLQRELRGLNDYLPTPSLPASWLQKSLAEYCRDLAALKGLPIPGARNWQHLEAAGWQRLAEVRNLELLRGLFRRPLELWLVLDRGLYLQEQGYDVRLGQFCSPSLTPRNLLLLAERP